MHEQGEDSSRFGAAHLFVQSIQKSAAAFAEIELCRFTAPALYASISSKPCLPGTGQTLFLVVDNVPDHPLSFDDSVPCMVRNAILRIPVLRALIPRVSRPLLPLTRLAAAGAEPRISLTRPGRVGTRLLHHSPTRLSSTSPPPSSHSSGPDSELPPNASLSQRLKHLIKAYGWYALGVYIILSVADFTVAFAAVNVLGAEHVGRVAASVKELIAGVLPAKPAEPGREQMDSPGSHTSSSGSEGLWAMVMLAYTIHKTLFLPVRVGLTAGVTPRLVGWLRSRGWAGSAGTKRAAQEMRERIRNRRERD